MLALALLCLAAPPDEPSVVSVVDWDRGRETLLDLSGFLDAPAGQHGFIRVDGEHLFAGDRRFRVWGTNIGPAVVFPSKADAEAIAADVARLGFNAVRFHHLDADWFDGGVFGPGDTTRRLDPEKLDRFDYFVAQLKERGVYTNVTLNVMRTFRPDDGVRDAQQLGLGKGATYFSPRLIELQEEFTRQLLTHVNPYTGNAYAREPAVCAIELVNENSLVESWMSDRLEPKTDDAWPGTWAKIPPSYAAELTDQFNAWLAERMPERLPEFRRQLGLSEGAAIPRSSAGGLKGRPDGLFRAEAEFIVETERRFIERMRMLIKDELDCPIPLIGSADHNDSKTGYPHLANNALLDVIDGHGYWQHPQIGATTRTPNTPMVNDPADSTIAQFARSPMAGRPFTVSETNYPWPHEYAVEGFTIHTAYSMLHGWDGVYWFNLGDGRTAAPKTDGGRDYAALGIPENGWFRFGCDPAKLPAIQTNALAWWRGHVAEARRTVVRRVSEGALYEGIRSKDWSDRPYFDAAFDPRLSLVHATRWEQSEEPSEPYPPAPLPGVIVSDTGQIVWRHADQGEGVVLIDTPGTQAVVGHLGRAEEPLTNLSLVAESPFGAVQLTTASDAPIADAEALVLLHAGHATNTGFAWEDDRKTVKEWGTGPTIVAPARGRVTLRGLSGASSVRVRPMGPLGEPLDGDFEAAVEDGVVTVNLPASAWSLIEVSR